MEEQSNQNWERTFNLFKLEYEQAAERYENIYKAIWQIFSYMGILAAGILTFSYRSSSSLPIQVTAYIALTPLLFWFLAIYIPMNHYGYKTRNHLGEIECRFNKISLEFFHHPWELKHYRDFSASNKDFNSKRKSVFKCVKNIIKSFPESFKNTIDTITFISIFREQSPEPWRVKRAIHTFGLIVLIAWIFLLFCTIQYYINNNRQSVSEKIELKLEPVEVTMQQPQLQKELDSLSHKIDSKVIMQQPQLQELQNKLDSLSQQINSIESLILDIKANSNQQ
ncbi:MAG: hypothetical protein AB4368_16945 [Xenococcaceae cyanobacterium]